MDRFAKWLYPISLVFGNLLRFVQHHHPATFSLISLQGVNMQEKPHVMYILNLLKNVLRPTSGELPNRLPVYSTLILLHALRGVFHPSILTFPLTSRFLLQRPELDTQDVPMLYSMLYNSSENWKKERTWIIRFLADGMMGVGDWKVFKRRHTWDLLASLFQSSRDRVTRVGIFDVISAFAARWSCG
jgi:nucleolar pre-ribosomal-associated protein 1